MNKLCGGVRAEAGQASLSFLVGTRLCHLGSAIILPFYNSSCPWPEIKCSSSGTVPKTGSRCGWAGASSWEGPWSHQTWVPGTSLHVPSHGRMILGRPVHLCVSFPVYLVVPGLCGLLPVPGKRAWVAEALGRWLKSGIRALTEVQLKCHLVVQPWEDSFSS